MQRFYTGSFHLKDMLLTANYRNHSRVNFPIQGQRQLSSVAVSKSPHLCGGAMRMFPSGLQCTDSEGVAEESIFYIHLALQLLKMENNPRRYIVHSCLLAPDTL